MLDAVSLDVCGILWFLGIIPGIQLMHGFPLILAAALQTI